MVLWERLGSWRGIGAGGDGTAYVSRHARVGVAIRMKMVSGSSASTQASDVDELALLLEAARRATWDATCGPAHLRSGRFFVSANMNAHASDKWASAPPATGESITDLQTHGRLPHALRRTATKK